MVLVFKVIKDFKDLKTKNRRTAKVLLFSG